MIMLFQPRYCLQINMFENNTKTITNNQLHHDMSITIAVLRGLGGL